MRALAAACLLEAGSRTSLRPGPMTGVSEPRIAAQSLPIMESLFDPSII